MSLGNVSIYHTIIINYDHPHIEESPTKLQKKKTWLKETCFIVVLMQMFLCSYLYSCILRIKTKRLLC